MKQRDQKSKRAARRARDKVIRATFGSHVGNPSSERTRKISSKSSFSHSRKHTQSRQGVVKQVMPETKSGESTSEHAKRVSKTHYTVALRRKARLKGLIIGIAVFAVISTIAIGVGTFVYGNSISERIALRDTQTKNALVSGESENISYVLVVGEYSTPGQSYAGPEVLILARLDQSQKQVSLMSIPYNTQVYFSNGKVGRIYETQLEGGDAALIKAVSEFADVKISHIVKANNEQFVDMIDSLGGVEFEVLEEIDDPNAGDIYIDAGHHLLNGKEALTVTRATNLSTGGQMQAHNQCEMLVSIVEKVSNEQGFNTFFTLDRISNDFETDLDLSSIEKLLHAFKEFERANVYIARVPGYATTSANTNIKYFIPDDKAFSTMMETMKAGQEPIDPGTVVEEVDPASFDITVRNGSGVTGGASQVSELLTSRGYIVTEMGNADQYVYDETLVIYSQEEMRNAAENVVSSLGVGRAVAANGFYSFSTGVLVMVGKDWKPFN